MSLTRLFKSFAVALLALLAAGACLAADIVIKDRDDPVVQNMEARYELVMSAGASGDIATYRQYRTAAVIKELEGCPRDKLCKAMWGGDPMKAMMGTAKIGAGLLKSEPFTLYEARIGDRAARLAYESVKAGKERTDTTFVVILFEKTNNDWKIGRVNFQSYVHGGSAPEKIEKYLTYPMNQFK